MKYVLLVMVLVGIALVIRYEVRMELGQLSAKYESNGKPGTVSTGKGDKGGKSYGMYQLALSTGALDGYISNSAYKAEFKGVQLGSDQFDTIWKAIAAREPAQFAADQHNYIQRIYYTPVRAALTKIGIPDTNAINQVIWSTSVQHGPAKAISMFKASYDLVLKAQIATSVDGKPSSKVGLDAATLINNVYKMREDIFKNSEYYNSNVSRRTVKDSVLKRYINELKDVLRLL